MGKKYSQLSLTERFEIYHLHKDGLSLRKIASILGRSASTISRELKRNSKNTKVWFNGYNAERANQLALRRRVWDKRHKLARQPALRAYVKDRLVMGWSPEQIAGRLAKDNSPMRISHESIYRYIYSRVAQKDYWNRLLPQKKGRRGKLKRGCPGKSPKFKHYRSIHERPNDVETRHHVGHWETDLMLFSKYGQAALTTYERKTRLLLGIKLPSKASDNVMNNLTDMLAPFPPEFRKSMTFDNGTEFALHYQLIDRLGIDTWFCDTYSPWQKGGVENGISRLRRALPRKTNLETLTQKEMDDIINGYNNTPRKCLGYKTPIEAFSHELEVLHFKRESTFLFSRE